MKRVIIAITVLVLLVGAASTIVTQNLVVQNTANLAAASASSLTTPAVVITGGGASPAVTSCNGGPGATTSTQGSVCVDSTGNFYGPTLYQNQDGTNDWLQLGAPAMQRVWSNPLGSLSGWTQNHGTWTISSGVFQADDGGAEDYIGDNGDHPFNVLCALTTGTRCIPWTMAVSVEVQFTSSAVNATNCGFVFWGANSAVTNGYVRVFYQKVDGTIGADVFGAAQTTSAHTPGGAPSANVWHRITAQWVGMGPVNTGTREGQISLSVDGQMAVTGFITGALGTLSPSSIGPWADVAHCQFRNWQVFAVGAPALPAQ